MRRDRLARVLIAACLHLVLVAVVVSAAQQQQQQQQWLADTGIASRAQVNAACNCNVQIVGGFNGSRGESGKDGVFVPGDSLNSPMITGEAMGGASYLNAALHNSAVQTSLRFEVDSQQHCVTIAAPDSASTDFTIKLPNAKGVIGAFLHLTSDGIHSDWLNAVDSFAVVDGRFTGGSVASSTMTDATIHSAVVQQSRASDALFAWSSPRVPPCTARSSAGALTLAGCVTLDATWIGGVVQWQGGQVSYIVSITSATVAAIIETSSASAIDRLTLVSVQLVRRDHSFSASGRHATLHAPAIYDGADRSVQLSLSPMAGASYTTLSFPLTAAADVLVGASAPQTLERKTLAATTTIDDAFIVGALHVRTAIASGGAARPSGYACTGASLTTLGAMTLSAPTDDCSFNARSVGSLVRWSDGTLSRVLDYIAIDSVVVSVPSERTAQPFTLVRADQHFSADGMFTNLHLPLLLHVANASVRLVNAQTGVSATWTFPVATTTNGAGELAGARIRQTLAKKVWTEPVLAGRAIALDAAVDELVGVRAVQTLANKTLASAVFAGVAVVPAGTGIQFVPANTTSWGDMNSNPLPGLVPARGTATGSNVLGSYETFTTTGRLVGFFATPVGDISWLSLRFTRINSMVIMCYGSFAPASTANARTTDRIWLDITTPVPLSLRPRDIYTHFIVPVVTDAGTASGKLVVHRDGRFEVARNPAGAAFDASKAGTQGLHATCIRWST